MNMAAYREFFTGFARLARPDAGRWETFFDEFSKNRTPVPEPAPAPGPELLVKEIPGAEAFFAAFSGGYASFMKTGAGVNIFDVVLPKFDELAHSRILAWLLDCSGSHGQKDAFLRLLLDAVPEEYKTERALFPRSIPENSRYIVKVEESYDEDNHEKKKRSRIDIELDGRDFLLFIEVKVTAGETDDQLSRYRRIFDRRGGRRPGGVIFLTPEGRSPKSELDKAVAPVAWRSLGRAFGERAEAIDSASHGKFLMCQFCDRIRNF